MLSILKGPYLQWPTRNSIIVMWAWHTAQALAVPHFVQVVVAGDTLALRAIDGEGRLFDTVKLDK